MSAILTIFSHRPRTVVANSFGYATPDKATRRVMQERTYRIEAARLCWACPF